MLQQQVVLPDLQRVPDRFICCNSDLGFCHAWPISTAALSTSRGPKQRLACAPISGQGSIDDPVTQLKLAHFPVREQWHGSKPLHALWPVDRVGLAGVQSFRHIGTVGELWRCLSHAGPDLVVPRKRMLRPGAYDEGFWPLVIQRHSRMSCLSHSGKAGNPGCTIGLRP